MNGMLRNFAAHVSKKYSDEHISEKPKAYDPPGFDRM